MRRYLSLLAVFIAAGFASFGQEAINDVLYNASGGFATGQVNISWPAFVSAADGHFVPAGSKIVAIGPSGAFSTTLEPNDSMIPAGTLYVVQYRVIGGPSPFPIEYWSCPTSGSPLTIPQCRTTTVASPSGIINVSQLSPVGLQGSCIQSTGLAYQPNPYGNCWNLQGTGVPVVNCTAGWVYFRLDASSGQNLYLCNPTNVWSQIAAGGTGTITSITAGCGLSGGTITSSGTIASQALVNSQTGTTYTYLTTDCGKLVSHSNASAIAATLPQATGSFGSGFYLWVENRGVGTVTITPTTSTVDGSATLALTTNQGTLLASDGTNWFTMRGTGSGGGGASSLSGLTDLQATTLLTVTTVASGNALFSIAGVPTTFTLGSGTITKSAGTDTGTFLLYGDYNAGSPVLKCVYGAGLTIGNYTVSSGFTGSTCTSGSAFPAGSFPIARLDVTSGVLQTPLDKRSLFTPSQYLIAGSGISISGNTISATGGTSGNVNITKVSVSSAELKTLGTVGKEVIAAQGANTSIQVLWVVGTYTTGTVAYTAGGNLQFKSAGYFGADLVISGIQNTLITDVSGAGTVIIETSTVGSGVGPTPGASYLINQNVFCKTANSLDFITGNGTLVLTIAWILLPTA